ncbi:hypothetical protein MMC13_004410 [Lambiella insularis]|nr:hypothetical protein [Lambiella insularis]
MRILVTGATGHQGGATISALLSTPYTPTIYAVTRSTDSPRAQSFAARGCLLLEGDSAQNPASLFQKAGHLDAASLVTSADMKDHAAELAGAKHFIDAALAAGCPHLVFTSVDRGGAKSDRTATPVPHFASKHLIEG